MYVTNVTVLRGDRGLTEATPYDILETVNRSPQFEWHYAVIFGVIREMFPHTGFTKMYVTNFTVLRGDRGLTEVTPYDILEAELGVHDLAIV